MGEARSISVVIPNRNGAATLGACLAAACASDHPRFEVVVVDDASEDRSAEIAASYPCRLIRLRGHGGVSRARNVGAGASAGDLLFFIDSDCLLPRDALSTADRAYGDRSDLVLGGTYTPIPADGGFFGTFQSVFIHHFETKGARPDYVAAHAMVVDAELFRLSGGFVEGSYIGVAASVEDVELSHRLRRAGCELAMDPALRVSHVFRFSLRRSLANAVKKARTWTMYALDSGGALADSGTASHELKTNVAASLASALLVAVAIALRTPWPAAAAAGLLGLDLWVSRGLVAAWARARGGAFAACATLYWTTLYAAAVGAGAALGAARWLWSVRLLRRYAPCTARSRT